MLTTDDTPVTIACALEFLLVDEEEYISNTLDGDQTKAQKKARKAELKAAKKEGREVDNGESTYKAGYQYVNTYLGNETIKEYLDANRKPESKGKDGKKQAPQLTLAEDWASWNVSDETAQKLKDMSQFFLLEAKRRLETPAVHYQTKGARHTTTQPCQLSTPYQQSGLPTWTNLD